MINLVNFDVDSTLYLTRKEKLTAVETYIGDLQLNLGHVLREKVISTLNGVNSDCLKVILTMIDNDLFKASSISGSVKPAFINATSVCDIPGIIEYAVDSAWIKTFQADVNSAILDYKEALRMLSHARKILDKTAYDLSAPSKFSGNNSIDSLLAFQTATDNSLENMSNGIKNALTLSSAIDTILEPGSLQAKSSCEVLKAKAELVNVNWFAARVSRSLDTAMQEAVKPFNRQFSDVSVIEPNSALVSDDGLNGADASGDDGNSGKKIKRRDKRDVVQIRK